MNSVLKGMLFAGLTLSSAVALAAPSSLITHNKTAYESNAWIDGTVPSPHATPAHSDKPVSWLKVKLACIGHVSNNICKALIKMETNTSHPVDLGWVSMNLITGDITPKEISANGYKLIVNGPGETTLLKND